MLTDEDLRDLKDLTTRETGPCVSLFMPVETSGPPVNQNRIRLKNLVKQAERDLTARGVAPQMIERLLEPARALQDDETHWKYAKPGLAMFCSADGMRRFELNRPVPEMVVVAQVFHVKPLFNDWLPNERFRVLLLSQTMVKLFEGDANGLTENTHLKLPQSLVDALGEDTDEDTLVHAARGTSGNHQRSRKPVPLAFHGHGKGDDDVEGDVKQFLRIVDNRLADLDDDRIPLAVAAVKRTAEMFRSISSYKTLLESVIEGDPQSRSLDELHKEGMLRAWPHLRYPELQARREIQRLHGSQRVSTDVAEILRAAQEGRVDTLFVGTDCVQWGRFDEYSRNVVLHDDCQPEDRDLIEEVIHRSLKYDARIFGTKRQHVPGGGPVAALYRYDVLPPERASAPPRHHH